MSHYSPFRSFSEHEGTCCTVGNARRKTLATSPGSLASSFAPSSLCYVVVLVDVHPVLLYSFSHSSTLMYRLSIFFQFPTPKDRTYTQEYKTIRRVRDVTHTDRATLSTYESRAPCSTIERFTPFFFFFDYYIRITKSNHVSRTPNTRNSVLFQPIHIRVRNLQRNEPMYHTVILSFSN